MQFKRKTKIKTTVVFLCVYTFLCGFIKQEDILHHLIRVNRIIGQNDFDFFLHNLITRCSKAFYVQQLACEIKEFLTE